MHSKFSELAEEESRECYASPTTHIVNVLARGPANNHCTHKRACSILSVRSRQQCYVHAQICSDGVNRAFSKRLPRLACLSACPNAGIPKQLVATASSSSRRCVQYRTSTRRQCDGTNTDQPPPTIPSPTRRTGSGAFN